MRRKYMNICLILGLLCLVYGLTVAIAGSGGTKFFIVWIGIAVILFALAGLLHMGIWDRIPQMIRWILGILCGVFFLSFLVIEGMVIRQMHAQGEDNLDYVIVWLPAARFSARIVSLTSAPSKVVFTGR